MFLRVDKLLTELPQPKKQDPNAGAALMELLGGKYGEMSTLNNYMFQSFNFRSKSKLRPIYEIVASITAEEVGHVELVSNGVAMLNNGPDRQQRHPLERLVRDQHGQRDHGHAVQLPPRMRRAHPQAARL